MSEVLQRVMAPAGDDAVASLYVARSQRSAAATANSEPLAGIHRRAPLIVEAGTRASFGTFFNAFPAGYWRRWTAISHIELTVGVDAPASIEIFRSDARGQATRVRAIELVPANPEEVTRATAPVDIDGNEDGGWLWFDVTAGDRDVTISDAAWQTSAEPVRRVNPTVGIPTFNKPALCAQTLRALADDPAVLCEIGRVLVVDQSNEPFADDPRARDALDALGDRGHVHRQPNFGGSGGFARVMLDALDTDADAVVMLDDDVVLEPESLRRAIMFERFARNPVIVGSQMLDLARPTVLHAWTEVIDFRPFQWRPIDGTGTTIDLAGFEVITHPERHAIARADFNGWWMSLIPRAAIEAVGLPIPAFLKWDDAEFSLRARASGISTVTVPGIALWHMAWAGKTDQTDWQAFFHARNRVLAALLHSELSRGGSVLGHSRRVDLKLLASMEYGAVALRHRGLRSLLENPNELHGALLTARAEALRALAHHDEALAHDAGSEPTSPREVPSEPRGWRRAALMATSVMRQWLRPDQEAATAPVLSSEQARWWVLAHLDAVIVRSPDGTSERRLRRRRDQFRAQLRESTRLHRELHRRWPELRTRYRSADLTSPHTWRETLDAVPDSPLRNDMDVLKP